MRKVGFFVFFLFFSIIFITGCIDNDTDSSKSSDQNTESIETNIDTTADKLLSTTQNNFTDNESKIAKQIDDSINSMFAAKLGIYIKPSDNQSDNQTTAKIENKAEAYNFYGVIFGLNNYTNLALYCFLKAFKQDSSNALYLSEIAAILIAQGKESEAKPFVELAEKSDISEPTVNITLATYYDLTGNSEKALTLYEKAVSINPKDPLLRQFFFNALANYDGFSEELLRLRKDTMKYCAEILDEAFDSNLSIREIMDYNTARSKEMMNITSEIYDISTSYTQEHLTNIYTVWEDLLFNLFEEWNKDETAILDDLGNKTDEAYEDLNLCAANCNNDSSCICGCINAYLSEISEYASTQLYDEIYSTINTRLPQSFKNLNLFETQTLEYIMKNIKQNDINSILNLVKFLYYNYQASCIDIGTNYLTTVYPYKGVYDAIYSMGNISCPPTEYPKAEKRTVEKAKGQLEESNALSNDLDNLFNNMKFKICIGGDLLGGCATYDKGTLGLEFSSAGVSLSGKRDLKTGRGLGGSIGLKYGKDIAKTVGIEIGTTLNFDNKGNLKGVSADSEFKAINGKKSLGKLNLFAYTR